MLQCGQHAWLIGVACAPWCELCMLLQVCHTVVTMAMVGLSSDRQSLFGCINAWFWKCMPAFLCQDGGLQYLHILDTSDGQLWWWALAQSYTWAHASLVAVPCSVTVLHLVMRRRNLEAMAESR